MPRIQESEFRSQELENSTGEIRDTKVKLNQQLHPDVTCAAAVSLTIYGNHINNSSLPKKMCSTDKECLEKLRNNATEVRAFLSNKMKPERERSVCRAFLRALGVSFDDSELSAPTDEPADVGFRQARFQVRDLLESDRRRGDDWKEKEQEYGDATLIAETKKPYSPPTPVDVNDLIPEVNAALSKKAKKYGVGCKNLDALIYVDLENKFLAPDSSVSNVESLKSQGWRSVSLLFSPYSVVLFAKPEAPDFLQAEAGQCHQKWSCIDTLFNA